MGTKGNREGATGQPNTGRVSPKPDTEEDSRVQQADSAEDIKDKTASAEGVGQGDAEALPPPPAGLPESYPRQGKPTMRKGVYLSALIYVEAERPPAQDFTREAKAAVRSALTNAKATGDLTISLKRITVRNNIEDEEPDDVEDAGASRAKQKEDSFEF